MVLILSENVGPHYTSKSSAINPQNLQSDEDEPLTGPLDLARDNMDGDKHSSQNTTSSDKAAIFSNDIPQGSQPISFPRIPPELVIRILLYLSAYDIISCGCTCRMLYDLCSCPVLRYLIQLERCAVNDDMHPGLGYPERLRILGNREEAWATLDFRKSVQLSVPFDLTGTYDLTGGALILGTRPSYANYHPIVGYSYVSLPSLSDSQPQNLEWKGISLETEMLDFGLAAHEYDLIAILTACVFPTLFIPLGFDFRKAKRT